LAKNTELALDRDAIARACRAHSVSRLTIFGSATSKRFDEEGSDVDFLVEFAPGAEDASAAYFGVKEDLEELLGRRVDLVMANAVSNPHFAASASEGAEEVYASWVCCAPGGCPRSGHSDR
jgi:predicted nucleotidyltransferase